MDEHLAIKMNHLPQDLRETWPKLAYVYFTPDKIWVLDEILQFLDHPALEMPYKHQVKKTLKSLKALIEVIPGLEEKINRIILSLKNGHLMVGEVGQKVPHIPPICKPMETGEKCEA